MKRQNVRTLSLIVCTLTYLMVGSAVFDALESEAELKQRQQVEQIRDRLVRKYNITDADFRLLESIIVRAIPHKAGHQWKFSGAFYFATTVITTIGYGHSCPVTIGGKIFCMFYALAGIPLGLVMFQSIGERLNTFCSLLLRRIKALVGRPPLVSPMDLIIVCTLLSTLCICIGAWVFSSYEGWTYFDSLYYCFVTLVTIGFGDFVALQKDGALENRPEYVLFVLFFIVFGLTVISAAMNLLVLRFLTLNTEDEKRDKREAKLAAKGLVPIDSLQGRRHYMKSRSSLSSSSSYSGGGGNSRSASPCCSIHTSAQHSEDEFGAADGGGGGARSVRSRSVTSSLRRRRKPTLTRIGPALLPMALRAARLDQQDTASMVSCSCYQLAKAGGVVPGTVGQQLQMQQQQQQEQQPTMATTTTTTIQHPKQTSSGSGTGAAFIPADGIRSGGDNSSTTAISRGGGIPPASSSFSSSTGRPASQSQQQQQRHHPPPLPPQMPPTAKRPPPPSIVLPTPTSSSGIR